MDLTALTTITGASAIAATITQAAKTVWDELPASTLRIISIVSGMVVVISSTFAFGFDVEGVPLWGDIVLGSLSAGVVGIQAGLAASKTAEVLKAGLSGVVLRESDASATHPLPSDPSPDLRTFGST